MATEVCAAAISGQGYWTCDVVGGCDDCRRIARSANDVEVLNDWNAERREARTI